MANFLELNTEGLYRSLGKEKEIVVLCSRPPQYVKIGVSRCVQRCVVCNDALCATMRCVQRCVVCNDALCATMTKKCTKMQSCCFANLNLLFCHSPCRRCRRCLSSLILNVERAGQLEKFVPF